MTGPTEHPLDVLREALRYQQGYDVAGWEAHLRDDEITAKHDAALLAVEQLEQAARAVADNANALTLKQLDAALAPFDRKEQTP